MTKMKSRFHYTDEKDMETTPEKAARITMLSFDHNQKICGRIDWIRDESNICKNCDTFSPEIVHSLINFSRVHSKSFETIVKNPLVYYMKLKNSI